MTIISFSVQSFPAAAFVFLWAHCGASRPQQQMDPKEYDIYQLSDDRQKELWADCIFVFDTSALLALYLYPEQTRQQIYDEIFEKIKDRLWIPHHVYFEYLKNRFIKMREPVTRNYLPLKEEFIRPIVDSFDKSLNRVQALRNSIKNADSHPYMVSEALEVYETQLKNFFDTTVAFEKTFSEQMEEKIREIQLLEQNDTVFQNIHRYFKVGREYSYDEILQITKEGKHRYEFRIPPGYEDLKDKIGTQIFGDLIIWKQIIEYAKERKHPIVFVSNDVKEDWWELLSDKGPAKKRIDGPRRELIKEIKDYAGASFWMYDQAGFLDVANKLIKSGIPNHFIDALSKPPASIAPDKYLLYTCEVCKEEDAVDTSSLGLKFEPDKEEKDKYRAAAQFKCRHCGNEIHAQLEVWQDPAGIIRQQQTHLEGASLLKETDTVEAEEGYEKGYVPEEERYVLRKKQLRLKKDKTRRILFKEPIDAADSIFEIVYTRKKKEMPPVQLQIRVIGADKKSHSKKLVVENGIMRFVMSRSEEQAEGHWKAVELLADADLAISLSIIEFPGTGRYIEKLYQ
jgi:hypothetical protein